MEKSLHWSPRSISPHNRFPKGVLRPPTQKFYICQSSPHTPEGSQTSSLHSLLTLLAIPSFSYSHRWRVDGGRERRGRKIFLPEFSDSESGIFFVTYPVALLPNYKVRALASTVIIFYSCIHICSLSSLTISYNYTLNSFYTLCPFLTPPNILWLLSIIKWGEGDEKLPGKERKEIRKIRLPSIHLHVLDLKQET